MKLQKKATRRRGRAFAMNFIPEQEITPIVGCEFQGL